MLSRWRLHHFQQQDFDISLEQQQLMSIVNKYCSGPSLTEDTLCQKDSNGFVVGVRKRSFFRILKMRTYETAKIKPDLFLV